MADVRATLDFGEFHADAMEVFETAVSGRILNGACDPGILPKVDYVLVDTLDGVERFRDPWASQRVQPGPEAIDFDFSWQDIRKIDMDQQSYDKDADKFWNRPASKSVFAARDPIWDRLNETLRANLNVDEILEICSQLEAALCLRCWYGKSREALAETIFQVLQAGGYCCGWSGPCPGGKLVIYWPADGAASE